MTRARILADYVAGGTTAAEFDYMDGVTSNVQTQLDAKAPLASPTFTGNFTSVGIDDNADATAITIDSSENVGIGTASPTHPLTVSGGYIKQTDGTRTTLLGADGTGCLFGTQTNHYLRFITNDTERMRILPTGGITFNGDTATANALDDYEEGTWTAVLKEGTTSITIGDATMVYVKVGKTVTVGGYFIINDSSIGTGAVSIEGLPYAHDNTINAAMNWSNFLVQDQYDDGFSTGGDPVAGSSHYSASKIYLNKNSFTGGGVGNVTGSHIQNTQQIRISGTYIAT